MIYLRLDINTKLRQKVDNFLNNGIQYRANTVDKFEDFKQIFDKSPSLRFIKRKWAVSNCMQLTATVITQNVVFNNAGPEELTKQHFCKILGRKPCLQGSFKDRGTSKLKLPEFFEAQTLLLHSFTHSEGHYSS